MGQKDNATFQYYITQSVGFDVQSVVQGRQPRSNLVHDRISMQSRKNINAPMPPGSPRTLASIRVAQINCHNGRPEELPSLEAHCITA
jgi:hypothetical protein